MQCETKPFRLGVHYEKEFGALLGRLRADGDLGGGARRELARLYVRLKILQYNNLRLAAELLERGGAPGAQSSISKVYWSEWHRDFGEAAVSLLGPYGGLYRDRRAPDQALWQRIFLESRAETVYAGTSEIQRNIIAEQVLGLPKEPRVEEAAERRSA